METMDAAAFSEQILKLGLVTEAQLAEVREELGEANPDLTHLLRVLERKSYLTPWQRGKVLKGDFDGFILGGYRLLYKIASGSFGRVYRADDPRSGRVVAVKVLRKRWSEDQQRIDLFIREGKLGLTLKHPNIVEVLAISRDPSSLQYYIVMEFVEGGNLREILQIRKKLSAAESLRILEDCTAGLVYAYARGMTHRDIKLTNILISSQGEAKLVDFGLAQFFAEKAKEEEKVDRTVDYAGLEKATGVEMGDVRSDIYFLGCVLYESLTGRPPLYHTRDRNARMRKDRFEQVPPINPNEVDGPPAALALVETMMSLDPKSRHQTPSQLLDAIKALRREVESKSGKSDGRPPTRSVFVVERDEYLQDILRDGLKDQGYRVFLAGDPLRALDRFRQQHYDGLIVDARTTDEDGLRVFNHIVEEAAAKRLPCAAILILAQDQASWAARVPTVPHSTVMGHGVTFKQLSHKLKELMAAAHPFFYTCSYCGAQIRALEKLADRKAKCPKCGAEVGVPFVSDVQPPTPARRALEALPREEAAPRPRRSEPKPPTPAPRPFEALPREEAAPQPRRSEPRWPTTAPPMRPVPREEPPAPLPPLPDPRGWRNLSGPPSLREREKEKDEAWAGAWNFWAKLTPKQRGIVIALGALALVLLFYFMFSGNLQNKFDKIEVGMTEAEVESILGKGEEEKEKEVSSPPKNPPGPKAKPIKTMKWEQGNQKITIMFSDGKVNMKDLSPR